MTAPPYYKAPRLGPRAFSAGVVDSLLIIPNLENDYALTEMIQWVWRTRIRNDEEVDLYLPSKRMRDIIDQWILKN